MMIDLAIGAALAGLTIWFFNRVGHKQERRGYAYALIVAALIYIGFSLRSERVAWILIETGGLAIFAPLAVWGLKRSPWFLVAGWAGHTVWDAGLHFAGDTPFVPRWYPVVCITYDLIIAASIAFRYKNRLAKRRANEMLVDGDVV